MTEEYIQKTERKANRIAIKSLIFVMLIICLVIMMKSELENTINDVLMILLFCTLVPISLFSLINEAITE